jgi:hypothetical protein
LADDPPRNRRGGRGSVLRSDSRRPSTQDRPTQRRDGQARLPPDRRSLLPRRLLDRSRGCSRARGRFAAATRSLRRGARAAGTGGGDRRQIGRDGQGAGALRGGPRRGSHPTRQLERRQIRDGRAQLDPRAREARRGRSASRSSRELSAHAQPGPIDRCCRRWIRRLGHGLFVARSARGNRTTRSGGGHHSGAERLSGSDAIQHELAADPSGPRRQDPFRQRGLGGAARRLGRELDRPPARPVRAVSRSQRTFGRRDHFRESYESVGWASKHRAARR